MATPFHSHLGTNYCPTDDEIPRIRAIIQAKTQAAHAIDKEIAQIMDSVSTLIKERDAHLDSVRSHNRLLGPIRRTPDDILSIIFQACIPQDLQRRVTMTHNHPAVVISHVCRRWRQLSLSTPQLWSGVHLLLPEYPVRQPPTMEPGAEIVSVKAMHEAVVCWNARVDQLLAIAKMWFTRSMEYPIDVTLGACLFQERFGGAGENFYPRIAKCLSLLCGVAHRWGRVWIDLSFGSSTGEENGPLEPLLSLQATDVPALKSLQIRGHRNPSTLLGEASECLMAPASNVLRGPALRTLYLDGVCHRWDALPIQWSCIRELRFSCFVGPGGVEPPNHFRVGEAFLLLTECHSLVVCDLTIKPSRPNAPHPPFVCTAFLPHLKSLTIRGIIPGEAFLNALNLPSLRALHLAAGITTGTRDRILGFGTRTVRNAGVALAWLQNFGHQLKTVQLDIQRLDADGVRGLLRCIPSVSELALRYGTIHYGVMPTTDWEDIGLARVLGPAAHDGDTGLDLQSVVCPRLRILRCDMRREPGSMTEESAVEIIACRRGLASAGTTNQGVIAQLENLTVKFGVPQCMDILEELGKKRVDLAGFRLDASYCSPVALKPHRFYDEAYLFDL